MARQRPKASEEEAPKRTRPAPLVDLEGLDQSQRKLVRQDRVARLIGEGAKLAEVYAIVRAEFGVTDTTIRGDIRAVGQAVKARLVDEDALHVEMGRALDRVRARAEGQGDVPAAVAQRADEWLFRFLVGSVDMYRLKQLGLDVKKHEARIAELEERRMAAQAELAEAEAQLARVKSDNVARPLAVYLVDLAAGVDEAEELAASPTLAAEARGGR